MPNSPRLEDLHRAVAAEKAELQGRIRQNKTLLAKMKAYQAGKGPAPSLEEFEAWRAGTELAVAERKLERGFVDLA